ncbi:hypothetical protein FQN50_007299 [Emmonsiellopsis sp. PD_5]|nr:hypothetical protein FQN50_007299 [Emmonsiellopsis sp. PD_5]
MMQTPRPLTIVIKLGTSSIVDEDTHEPILSNLTLIVETAAKLVKNGNRVILVSSGAVGVGLRRMDVDKRPTHLPRIQVRTILPGSAADRWLITTQYRNAENTFAELLKMGVIPIVNENDTLAVAEIKFGDNDTLSAITAAMVRADYLFLMTDVDGLYTSNPRTNPDAQVIDVVSDISTLEADVSSAGSSLGTGGMSTKIVAARLATSAGVTTIITRSSTPGNILDIVKYLTQTSQNGDNNEGNQSPPLLPPLHTRFLPSPSPIHSRSFWLLHGLTPHGTIYIDHGAYSALLNKAGLLPAGILAVEGNFSQQESVKLVVIDKPRPSPSSLNGDYTHQGDAAQPREVGRALVNYSSNEVARIKGLRSNQIHSVLGYADSQYVALRENISFFQQVSSERSSRPATPSLDEFLALSRAQSPTERPVVV